MACQSHHERFRCASGAVYARHFGWSSPSKTGGTLAIRPFRKPFDAASPLVRQSPHTRSK
eukprot:scaffold1282_cov251-Pinguiococcus_pyrenoidosus.AAC.60